VALVLVMLDHVMFGPLCRSQHRHMTQLHLSQLQRTATVNQSKIHDLLID